MWTCPGCEYENEETEQQCAACDEARPAAEVHDDEDDTFTNIVIGKIVECSDASNAALKLLKVDVGAETPLDIVTNATNVREGVMTVVALVGAVVKGETVKKTAIKGHPSSGMLCDGPVLGWTGGGAGAAVILPATGNFKIGAKPPAERPRGGPAA